MDNDNSNGVTSSWGGSPNKSPIEHMNDRAVWGNPVTHNPYAPPPHFQTSLNDGAWDGWNKAEAARKASLDSANKLPPPIQTTVALPFRNATLNPSGFSRGAHTTYASGHYHSTKPSSKGKRFFWGIVAVTLVATPMVVLLSKQGVPETKHHSVSSPKTTNVLDDKKSKKQKHQTTQINASEPSVTIAETAKQQKDSVIDISSEYLFAAGLSNWYKPIKQSNAETDVYRTTQNVVLNMGKGDSECPIPKGTEVPVSAISRTQNTGEIVGRVYFDGNICPTTGRSQLVPPFEKQRMPRYVPISVPKSELPDALNDVNFSYPKGTTPILLTIKPKTFAPG